jgi:hypothetical protein
MLRAARLATIALMTPEENAARIAADAARATGRTLRRRERVAQALLVNQRLSIGDKPEEISARLKISLRSLQRHAKRWGHALVQRAGFRRVSAWVADRHVTQLDKLALEAGVSREKVLERILADALADGAHIARRMVLPAKRPGARIEERSAA